MSDWKSRLRAIQEQRQEKTKETAELVRSLNNTNVGLQQFRFSLSDHNQTILLGLHRIIVGALGLIVVLSCTLLYLLNRHLATPMLNLCRLTAAEGESKEGATRMFPGNPDQADQRLARRDRGTAKGEGRS